MKTAARLFLGVARHLNYRRTFLARDCVRVDIPGLPYTAFDNTGIRVYPWSVLNLIESVRSFTFSDHSWSGEQGRSLLDFHDILNNHLLFVIGTNVQIDPKLYDYEAPKFPLYVVEKLKYLGKSSKTLSYELYHSDTDTLYATCDVTDVLVSEDSRKPIAYPDWWMQRYGDLITTEKAKITPELIPESQPRISDVKVKVSDLDTFKHTNWTPYLKYCYESLYEHTVSDSYGRFDMRRLNGGTKAYNMIYKDESNLGDILTVKSWVSDSKDSRLVFDIYKGQNVCFHSYIDF